MQGTGAYLGNIRDFIAFRDAPGDSAVAQLLETAGNISGSACEAVTFDTRRLPVCLYANHVTCCGGEPKRCYVFYLFPGGEQSDSEYDTILSTVLNTALVTDTIDASLQGILVVAGQKLQVDRAFIFEEENAETVSNTYEWCADGILSAMQFLQALPKKQYTYDTIAQMGMLIANDISSLHSENGFPAHTDMQAMAVIPFFNKEVMTGYVGFGDCGKTRVWRHEEIQFIQSITTLISLLIHRRDTERELRKTSEMLQIMSDNSDSLIYVNRLKDYKLVFVSRALCTVLGKTQEELLNQPCWKVLQKGCKEPCDFCPIPNIPFIGQEERSEVYIWEKVSPLTGKPYLVRDNIVRWMDGDYVHVEVAQDITRQKENEAKLQYYASTDTMTDVYNREWGTRLLEERLSAAAVQSSLCFLDLDGFKDVNDRYGHKAGDAYLVETVRLLKQHLREGEFICRWGGDEFLICLNGTQEQAQQRILEMQDRIRLHNRESQRQYCISFSYGLVSFTAGTGMSLDALVAKADSLMYEQKNTKKDQSESSFSP